ncbi:MAG: carbohydrate ABC transporter permease [Atribacterota bacterium]
MNSASVACLSTIIGLVLAIPAAYVLSQVRGGLSRTSLVGLLIIRMIPPIIFLVPIYIIYNRLNLLGSRLGLIFGYQVFLVPFATWVIWSFFKDLPRDLVDASRIDGCSPIGTLLHIFLPLATPIVSVAFIFCFIFCWNEFMFALVLTGRVTRTAPVITATFLGERDIDWPAIAAAGTALITPTVVLMFFVAERLVRGLTAGALKE